MNPEEEKSDEEIVAEYQFKWQQVSAFWRPFLEQHGKKEVADKLDAVYSRAAQEIPKGLQIKFWPHYVHWLEQDMLKLQDASEEEKKVYVESLEGSIPGIEFMLKHFEKK